MGGCPLHFFNIKEEGRKWGAGLQKLIIGVKLGEQDRVLRSLLFILMANE